MRTGKEDRDQWIVKCPKCGRVRESCRHISRDDVRRIVKLLDAGVEVYQPEDDREASEPHVHEPARPVAQSLQPRFTMADLVLAETTGMGSWTPLQSSGTSASCIAGGASRRS